MIKVFERVWVNGGEFMDSTRRLVAVYEPTPENLVAACQLAASKDELHFENYADLMTFIEVFGELSPLTVADVETVNVARAQRELNGYPEYWDFLAMKEEAAALSACLPASASSARRSSAI